MKILITEDEADIAESYRIILEKRNHHVIIANDGEECLKAYNDALKSMSSSTSSPFDAVVLDYRMPKKDGMEVAKKILAMNPRQRIIFASAYVEENLNSIVQHLKIPVELMQKPFNLDEFVEAVENKGHGRLDRFGGKLRKVPDLSDQGTMHIFRGLLTIDKHAFWHGIGCIQFL